jgi:hypothetical protein
LLGGIRDRASSRKRSDELNREIRSGVCAYCCGNSAGRKHVSED